MRIPSSRVVDATRQDAILGATGDAVPYLDLDPPEAKTAIADACRRHRVGDERDSAGRGLPDDRRRLVGEVVAVEDHLDDDVLSCERCAGQTRIPVRERRHRVEEVRDRAHTAVEREIRLGRCRVRVAARDDDAALLQHVDQLERSVQLGSERHLRDRPGLEQPLEESQIGISARRRWVCAEALGREKRALEMGAEDARSRRCRRNRIQRCDEIRLGRGDEGRLECRHACFEQRLAGAAVAVGIRSREVDSAEAVDLQVDETGNCDPAPGALAEGDVRDGAVRDRDVSRDEDALDDGSLDAEPHRASRLFRTLPLATFSRNRASSALTPASSETMATLASPRAASSAASASSLDASVTSSTVRRARASASRCSRPRRS